MTAHAVWHDVECGRYVADLPLWLELAHGNEHGVLDVGAGTGRVALALAAAGHAVTALDVDGELLEVLRERAGDLPVRTLRADAMDFTLPEPVDLILVPMQTLQLLDDRDAFFACARRALVPGGRLAAAIAVGLETFDGLQAPLPAPDVGDRDGVLYVSQPVAIRIEPGAFQIERVRRRIGPDGTHSTDDVIRLAVVTPGGLAEEAALHGLDAESLLHVPETEEHVGSEVVVFRG